MRIAGWNKNATATNAVATATKATDANRQQIIAWIDVSFSAAPATPVLAQIKDSDANILWQRYFSASDAEEFSVGLTVPPGKGVSANVAAAGSGVVGSINLGGWTV